MKHTSLPEDIEAAEIDVDDPVHLPGVVVELGQLGPSAIITEEGVARLFSRHVASVKRAVQRGELPPPCRLFGGSTWTVGALVRHIEKRLEQAAREAEQTRQKIAQLSP